MNTDTADQIDTSIDDSDIDEPSISQRGLTDKQIENLYEKGRFRILQERNDFMLPQVVDYVKREKWMNIRPEYQRRARWSQTKKSQLIESFLMNIPVPPVFLYEGDMNRYEVMDGQQRLNAILEFYNNDFRLTGLKIWASLNGKTFSRLPAKLRRGLDRAKISSIILIADTGGEKDSLDDIRSQVFERLNTGGEKLNPQELRNCLYSGNFNDLIIQIASDIQFTSVWGIPSHEENITGGDQISESLKNNTLYKNMVDCEIVLRFFAFSERDFIKGSVRKILDQCMVRHRYEGETWLSDNWERYFSALSTAVEIFGENTFRLPSKTSDRRSLSRPLYDAVMITLDELSEHKDDFIRQRNNIAQAIETSLGDDETYSVIVGRPNTSQAIIDRIDKVKDLFLRSI